MLWGVFLHNKGGEYSVFFSKERVHLGVLNGPGTAGPLRTNITMPATFWLLRLSLERYLSTAVK